MAGMPPAPGQTTSNGSWDPTQLPPAPTTGQGLRASLGMGVPRIVAPKPMPVGYRQGTEDVQPQRVATPLPNAQTGFNAPYTGPSLADVFSGPSVAAFPTPAGPLKGSVAATSTGFNAPSQMPPPPAPTLNTVAGRGMPAVAAPAAPAASGGGTVYEPSGQYVGAISGNQIKNGLPPVAAKPEPRSFQQKMEDIALNEAEMHQAAAGRHPELLAGAVQKQLPPQQRLQNQFMKYHEDLLNAKINNIEPPPSWHNAHETYFNAMRDLLFGANPLTSGIAYGQNQGMVDPNQ